MSEPTLSRLRPEDQVLAANDAFYRAFASADMGAMDALWARTVPVACLHPGWTLLNGRSSVIESWEAILANPTQPRIVAGGADAHVYGDVAVVLCREVVAGSPLYATNVFVREGGQWKIAHHHSGPVAMR